MRKTSFLKLHSNKLCFALTSVTKGLFTCKVVSVLSHRVISRSRLLTTRLLSFSASCWTNISCCSCSTYNQNQSCIRACLFRQNYSAPKNTAMPFVISFMYLELLFHEPEFLHDKFHTCFSSLVLLSRTSRTWELNSVFS